jgi:CRP/FNR family cyclic AMP-dependent transcriptional regulator
MSYELYVKLLFEDFSQAELKEIIKISQPCNINAGDYLFKEGEESNSLYIIFTGKVEITSKSDNEEKISFPVLVNGTVLGEIAFFDGKPRTASVRAFDDIYAMKITKEAFDKLEINNPKLVIKLLKEMGRITAERLRWADEQVKELSNKLISNY